jgi:hypothetical protein
MSEGRSMFEKNIEQLVFAVAFAAKSDDEDLMRKALQDIKHVFYAYNGLVQRSQHLLKEFHSQYESWSIFGVSERCSVCDLLRDEIDFSRHLGVWERG